MAKFMLELPDEIIKDVQRIESNADEIFGEMTRAGAETVQGLMSSNAPSAIRPHIKLSKTYKTPSDDGISTQVYVSGWFPLRGGRKFFERRGNGGYYRTSRGVPVDFVAKIYEYGRSGYRFPRKPFFRKAFKNRGAIESAMLKAQKNASGGLLDDE